ncbi:MAG: NAD(P)-dependent oxidoreductase [Solirubrobacterales bacterium]|nr:NAD(P)-dependent oxidoreductase [Solirubrobacterales bacterium]
MATDELVAVLGAGGTMGLGMSRNLARAGIRLRAWNRSREKAQPLSEDGVVVCASAAEAVAGAGIAVTMLADADAVLKTAAEVLPRLGEDGVWLQMSTIGEAGTERCIELASEHSVSFFDAPVLGSKQPAAEGKLVVLASGPAALADRVWPVWHAVAQKTIWVGEAGAGTRLKVVTNSWVLTVTEACAEMIALARGLDVDPKLIFEAIEGGTLDLPYLRMKAKAILDQNYEPMFRLALAAKDAGLIEESAERHGVEVPLYGVIRRQMLRAAEEHGDEDMSATYFASAPAAFGS